MSNPTLFVLLGRNGDILACLPMLHLDAQRGQRDTIMVAKEYAPLLEGISYADVAVFEGDVSEIARAVTEAKAMSANVVALQTMGEAAAVKQHVFDPSGTDHATTDSFVKEMWRIAGRLDDWKKMPPLVFDKRNPDREHALISRLPLRAKKPIILVHTEGKSSPFGYEELLFELLRMKFPKCQIVNLNTVKAEYLFDMLGLFEIAKCLVAIDSAMLHLAWACPKLPVVALVQDTPLLWSGSPWRPNHIAHCRYSEFPARCLSLMQDIADIGKAGCITHPVMEPKIIHAWSQYEIGKENQSRHTDAWASWQKLYSSERWLSCRADVGVFGRDSAHGNMQDPVRLPYVKDVIRLASLRSGEDDLICLTRADACITPDCTDKFLEVRLGWARRHTIDEYSPSIHPAADVLLFPAKWWRENQLNYPDLLMGADPFWHRVLMELIKEKGGVDLGEVTYRRPSPPRDYSLPREPGALPKRVTHNEGLYSTWMKEHGVRSMYPPVQDQVATWALNRRGLFPYAYNPSIVQHEGKLLMAYRWHAEGNFSTKLALCELDKTGNAVFNEGIELRNGSIEDPRFFIHGDQLWISYVESKWPMDPPFCVVKYGQFILGPPCEVLGQYLPEFGHNDGEHLEKNWVFFSHGTKLYAIYQFQPEQVIIELSGAKVVCEHRAPCLRWKWGGIKGGTPPIRYGDNLMRFFHSTLDNEPPPFRRRYYLGAMIMEPTPPFKPLALSQSPIAYGSELDTLSDMERAGCLHGKQKVIFPGGVIPTGDGWLVSTGINDSACVILKISEKELKL